MRIETELDQNLGVEAGAGTGKTTVLVERVTDTLASGRTTVDELVVITFTEKAGPNWRRQDELLSSRSAELDRALSRGLGLDEIREASAALHRYR